VTLMPLWAQDADDDDDLFFLAYLMKKDIMHLSDEDILCLDKELNDAVARVCQQYDID
jgi:hypothetical protein